MGKIRSVEPGNQRPQRPLRRRILYLSIIYSFFLIVLAAIEIGVRFTQPHVSSLDLFVNTQQQIAQVANPQQAGIFEGDPLLLWRLKPNLDHVVWDFTVVSTNAQSFRMDHPLQSKAPGTTRIICLGDSVTFGYRVPTVWPERPKDYDPTWLPYPMLLEKALRAANPDKQIEVIDMAVPGYTSHQGLAWLRRDIDYLQPDLIIASFGWNDASFSDAPDRATINTGWVAVTARWMVDHSQAFAHANKWLRSRRQLPKTNHQQAHYPAPRVSDQEYINNMNGIVRLSRERGAGVIIIGAPYRDAVTNPAEAELMMRYRSTLRSAMQQQKIAFIEIPELTEAAHPGNLGWFGELIHPNHMGHRLMASELLKLFKSKKALDAVTIPEITP